MNNLVTVNLASEGGVIRKSVFYQYDYGIKLRLENTPDCSLLVEFCNYGDKEIKHDELFTGDDILIPTDLLLDGRDLWIFISATGTGYSKTLKEIIVKVNRRPWR